MKRLPYVDAIFTLYKSCNVTDYYNALVMSIHEYQKKKRNNSPRKLYRKVSKPKQWKSLMVKLLLKRKKDIVIKVNCRLQTKNRLSYELKNHCEGHFH